MARKKTIPKDQIKDIVKEELKNIASDEDDFEISGEDTFVKEIQDEKDHEVVNKILQSFPSSQGFYGKLYRKTPSGKFEFKYTMDFLEEIDDPELTIMELIKENGWPDGTYALRIFKKGDPECKKTILWQMATGSGNNNVNKEVPVESVEKKLEELSSIMKMVKDVTGSNKPEDNLKLLSDALKTGMDITKKEIGTDPEDKIFKTVSLLKELGIIKNEPEEKQYVDPVDSISKIMVVLKEMGIIGEKRDTESTILESLLKFKELGLIKLGSEENDTLSQVEKLKTLIDVVTPLAGLNNEKPSIGVELVRILGPQVPKIVENITTTINNVSELSKLKLLKKMNVVPDIKKSAITVQKNKPETEISADPYSEDPEQIEMFKTEEPEKKEEVQQDMNSMLKKIHNAIFSKDEKFYPELLDLIKLYVANNTLDQIVAGEVTVSAFLNSIADMLGQDFFRTPEAFTYFENFIKWYKDNIVSNIIIAVCDKCKEEYEFESDEIWEKDTKDCDCGGKLTQKV
jgi:hypothetical protein